MSDDLACYKVQEHLQSRVEPRASLVLRNRFHFRKSLEYAQLLHRTVSERPVAATIFSRYEIPGEIYVVGMRGEEIFLMSFQYFMLLLSIFLWFENLSVSKGLPHCFFLFQCVTVIGCLYGVKFVMLFNFEKTPSLPPNFINLKCSRMKQLHHSLENVGHVREKLRLMQSHSAGESLLILTQNSVFPICWVNRKASTPTARKTTKDSWTFAHTREKLRLMQSHSAGESLLILTQNSVFTICWVIRKASSPTARKTTKDSWTIAHLGVTKQNLTGQQGNQGCNKNSNLGVSDGDINLRGKKTAFCDYDYKVATCGKKQHGSICQPWAVKTPGDNEPGIVQKTFDERKTEVKLLNPPTFDPRDQRQRLQTFQGLRTAWCLAENLSTAGFYAHGDVVTCYSCQDSHSIEDFGNGHFLDAHWHAPSCAHLDSQRSPRSVQLQSGQTASDGRVSDDIADPPGQQSIYIPPGDIRREAYRLSTFEQFPVTCSISRKSLAKSGFYFTGFYDRAKCFACARTVERWEETDNPAELKWHKPNCPFPRGVECGNVSLPSLFTASSSAASSSAVARQPNPAPQPSFSGEQIIEQRDPNTGAIIRRVRYPNDLPERIRQTGGTFEIGPNNQVTIRSGPGPAPRNPAHIGLGEAQQQPRRQWRMANVISADHKRFLTNLFLNRELDRLSSFARWPVGRPNIAPAYLAKSGFFYLGDMDRTQCFSCGGVLRNWNLEDDAEVEHRTHFPQCRMVVGSEPRNIPVRENPETEEEKENKYTLRFPANPHMRSEAARLGTFDRRWPMGKTAATPAEISQAGFFFLGDRDRAKCWYCNGGLQNWEYDDIPWIEHAKWFPNCQFLLRVKGQHFVYRHLALNPHLARPIIARQDGSPLESVGGQPAATSTGQAQRQRSQDVPPSEPRVNQPPATPIIVDPREEMRRRKDRVENIMKNSENVKVVLAMGFDSKIVAALLEDKIDSGNVTNPNDIYESVSELLDDVAKKEEELKKEEEERTNQALAPPPTPQPLLTGPSSMRTMSSMYSGVSGASGMSSLGPAPGSGKYNVSYFGGDDDEDEIMDQDMYGSMEGTSSSLNSVTATKHLQGAEENSASLQEALNKIEEERMCKICFANQADMVFVPCAHMCCCMECTQAITQCPVCRKKIEKAIKTYIN